MHAILIMDGRPSPNQVIILRICGEQLPKVERPYNRVYTQQNCSEIFRSFSCHKCKETLNKQSDICEVAVAISWASRGYADLLTKQAVARLKLLAGEIKRHEFSFILFRPSRNSGENLIVFRVWPALGKRGAHFVIEGLNRANFIFIEISVYNSTVTKCSPLKNRM